MKTINLLLATNESYVIATRTLLASIKKAHERTKDSIHVFVMYSNLSDASIEKIMGDSSDQCLIEMVLVDDSSLDGVPTLHHLTKETYFRLLASDYLPNGLDRILWLDSDMIVVDSLGEFYRQDMGSCFYAAYEDELINAKKEYATRLGISEEIPYAQAGTLLINLSEIRKESGWKERILQYVRTTTSRLDYADQDIINVLFNTAGRVKVLEPPYRYNRYASRATKHETWAVLHYAGSCKPWNGVPMKWYFLWWKYACMIPEYRIRFVLGILHCISMYIVSVLKLVYSFLIKRKYGKYLHNLVRFLKKGRKQKK